MTPPPEDQPMREPPYPASLPDRLARMEMQIALIKQTGEQTATALKEIRDEKLGRIVDALASRVGSMDRLVERHDERLEELEKWRGLTDLSAQRRAGGWSTLQKVAAGIAAFGFFALAIAGFVLQVMQ